MKSLTQIYLRSWNKKDFTTVRNILLKTWKYTYTFIPEKDIIAHLNNFYSIEKLNALLNDPHSVGIIAEVKNIPSGWMKLFEDKSNNKFFISSLYVLPEFQGFGIGKKLLDEAYRIALSKNLKEVWLGVMEQNKKAVEWYQNLGYNFSLREPFRMGSTEVQHLIGSKSLK